ncbi:MAG: PEP-CTERM sorting domain-containing protein [Zoogloea sp.]|uniref:PEP-CTERM sorting domain-containing protein n=1 Tax=Zoogloea sp. TaxID=49181 RepID=UPI00261B1D7B|nr:PEP-CTERM sorting domain-containing protein [Zoogloea sp.]MDD2988789.1 PEP-CTERM sorting domain-containing protein [Zoogloea sp.]
MRTPTTFKYLLCCRLLIVAALALPTPAQTTVVTGAGLSDPATVSPPPTRLVTPLPPPPADNTLQALLPPTALDEQAQSSALATALISEPAAVVAPEPSALLLLAIGIGVLWLIRRKR